MPKQITIYSRVTCAPCNMVKQLLNKKGIQFTNVDIDEDTAGAAEAYRLAGMSIVPVTVITNQDDTQEVISGFNIGRLMPAIS